MSVFGPTFAQIQAAAWSPRLAGAVDWVADLAGRGAFVGDLGCADGLLLAGLRQKGIMGTGVDASEALVGLARGRGVSATHTALRRAMLPPASLIVSLGGALARFDDADTPPAPLTALLPRLIQTLKPGGALLLELPGQGLPTGTTWQEGPGWSLYCEAETEGRVHSRHLVGFAEVAPDHWTRAAETHHYAMMPPAQVQAVLTNAGLSVEPVASLGDAPVLPGHFALLGRKP